MRRTLAYLLLAICAGCFTSVPPPPTAWMVEPRPSDRPVTDVEKSPAAFGTTRIGTIVVSAPFDRAPFVVRRADGSVAFDAFNAFAAAPATLLRQSVKSQLASDGRFGHVVSPSSVASADASVEVLVTDLSLDCSESGKRMARAAVSVDVVKTGRGSRVVAFSADGAGEADAASGNYSDAFSIAFNSAFAEALKGMK